MFFHISKNETGRSEKFVFTSSEKPRHSVRNANSANRMIKQSCSSKSTTDAAIVFTSKRASGHGKNTLCGNEQFNRLFHSNSPFWEKPVLLVKMLFIARTLTDNNMYHSASQFKETASFDEHVFG